MAEKPGWHGDWLSLDSRLRRPSGRVRRQRFFFKKNHLTRKTEALNSASPASGRDYWKEVLLRNNRLTRNTEATTSPPPPSPGVKRWGRFSGFYGLWNRWSGKRNAGGGVLAIVLRDCLSTLTSAVFLKRHHDVALRRDVRGISSIIRRTNAKSDFGPICLGQKSTQPESLILAQSERWRQA